MEIHKTLLISSKPFDDILGFSAKTCINGGLWTLYKADSNADFVVKYPHVEYVIATPEFFYFICNDGSCRPAQQNISKYEFMVDCWFDDVDMPPSASQFDDAPVEDKPKTLRGRRKKT